SRFAAHAAFQKPAVEPGPELAPGLRPPAAAEKVLGAQEPQAQVDVGVETRSSGAEAPLSKRPRLGLAHFEIKAQHVVEDGSDALAAASVGRLGRGEVAP